MDSTSQSLAKAKSMEEKREEFGQGQNFKRNICKGVFGQGQTWELESAKALPKREGSISEASLP